ncbi:hypothetical protein Tco_1153074 [Tanacetum coccineum]
MISLSIVATKPQSALRPPAGLAAAADELSHTSYPGTRAIPNLFRGGKVTSGLSSPRLAEGSSSGGDEVGTDMGKGGGIPNDGASGLVGESMEGSGGGTGDNTGEGGDSGSDGEGIWGSGEDHGKNGDDGGVDIARSMATSASDISVGTRAGLETPSVTVTICKVVKAINYRVRRSWVLPPPPHHGLDVHSHHPHHPADDPLLDTASSLPNRQDTFPTGILLGVIIVILLTVLRLMDRTSGTSSACSGLEQNGEGGACFGSSSQTRNLEKGGA